MKRICVTLFFGLILFSLPAFPAGFGVYGTGGYGKVDMMKIINNGDDYRVLHSINSSFYGGGLMLETGGKDKEYHNRLNLGVEGATPTGGRYQYRRFMRVKIENIFAFRVAGNDIARFWIGPLIGIQLLTGHASNTRNSLWSTDKLRNHMAALWMQPSNDFRYYGFYYIYSEKLWRRKFGVFIPIGAALGVNINLADKAALTIEGGFRCGFFFFRNGGFNYEGYGSVGFLFGAL